MRASRAVLLCLLVLPGCTFGPAVFRAPIPVPVPAGGGARTFTEGGVLVALARSEALLGQEQAEVGMTDIRIGLALFDRIEVGYGYHEARGDASRSEPEGLRLKVRLVDLADGRVSVGVRFGRSSALRRSGDVQDERVTATDLALPVSFHPRTGPAARNLEVYAGPRVIHQSFDQLRLGLGSDQSGVFTGAMAGVVGRWRRLHVNGELNLGRTPQFRFDGVTWGRGWVVLPALEAGLVIG